MPLCIKCYKVEVAADELYCDSCKTPAKKEETKSNIDNSKPKMLKFGWIVFILAVVSLVTLGIYSAIMGVPSWWPIAVYALTAYLGWILIRGNRNKVVFGFTIFMFIVCCLVFASWIFVVS